MSYLQYINYHFIATNSSTLIVYDTFNLKNPFCFESDNLFKIILSILKTNLNIYGIIFIMFRKKENLCFLFTLLLLVKVNWVSMLCQDSIFNYLGIYHCCRQNIRNIKQPKKLKKQLFLLIQQLFFKKYSSQINNMIFFLIISL